MWSPTHIQVTVQRAKGLLAKGKNGTNNCFVTIGLGKEKYQTSIKEKSETNVSWNEECELKIPDQGNRAELVLTCLHRNNLSIDEFLGQITLPLNEMDVYNRPRSTWFKLESKPGKEKKNKERGELEVRISFIVKSGSLTDLSKKDKHKSSIGQLASSVGGSLLSIGTIEKRKGIKKFAKSLGSKMHLHSKKKNKDGDDGSFTGSFASVGTPTSSNGGSRRYGQRAGEADPGVISEDEDEFVFDNLSHKSSGSSLNIRSNLHPPMQNFEPRHPSPLLRKNGGKQYNQEDENVQVDPEMEKIEHDVSIQSLSLPPPSKPPRTPQFGQNINSASITDDAVAFVYKDKKLDEWEKKLYGKQYKASDSNSLKRNSREFAPVRLPTTTTNDMTINTNLEHAKVEESEYMIDTSSSSLEGENSIQQKDNETNKYTYPVDKTVAFQEVKKEKKPIPKHLKIDTVNTSDIKVTANLNLLSPDIAKKNFNEFNATFAKFEQKNSAKFFDLESDVKLECTVNFLAHETQIMPLPQPKPRIREVNIAKDIEINEQGQEPTEVKREMEVIAESKPVEVEHNAAAKTPKVIAVVRTDSDTEVAAFEEDEAKLKWNIESTNAEKNIEHAEEIEKQQQINEKCLHKIEENLTAKFCCEAEEEKRRELKRFEEDQKILNFARRSKSIDEGTKIEEQRRKTQVAATIVTAAAAASAATITSTTNTTIIAEQSLREKRLSKFKFINKRDKLNEEDINSSPKAHERIIIGHEKATTHAERRSEISAALSKKYDGKSREELMLIANGMENEALIQRQRVKELEDYLDNLLLRVMETHPKILQNPYSRTTSAKSLKNYINLNNYLQDE